MMIDYTTVIQQYGENGDKTGWTFVIIPSHIAQEILPGNKRAMRLRGYLDEYPVSGMSMLPAGEGNFILALKAEVRKAIRKERGAMLRLRLEHDKDFKLEMPAELLDCFEFEPPEALAYFDSLSKSHQGYFFKWINDAKTEQTRASRIAATISAANRRMDYGAMLRELKKLREG
ncbi:YdeI/OmpD-associated family protein [Mucilaginibacter sp. 21P]|uniref:YdeI/OmpD-associated family protein n=1 Tax=Mucilaginibacter sp. 21P TaxID=2778902 RepID=UPI00210693A5|nr:YdeI/OmpD-associated family protein [Mucilaginibacter sp. 21P]